MERDKKGFTKVESTILKKMCKMVGANYNKIDFNDKDYTKLYTWTNEQEIEFEDWMYNYLRPIEKTLSDSELLNEVRMFVYDCGWWPKPNDPTDKEEIPMPIHLKRLEQERFKRDQILKKDIFGK